MATAEIMGAYLPEIMRASPPEIIHFAAALVAVVLVVLAFIQACKATHIQAKRRIHHLNLVSGSAMLVSLPMRQLTEMLQERVPGIWRGCVMTETLISLTLYLTGCYVAYRCHLVYATAKRFHEGPYQSRTSAKGGVVQGTDCLSLLFPGLAVAVCTWEFGWLIWALQCEGLVDADQGKDSEIIWPLHHLGRVAASTLVSIGIVTFLILDKQILQAARYAVVAADTPLLRPKSRRRVTQSTQQMQSFINRLAVFASVSGVSAVLASLMAYWGTRMFLYPAAVLAYGFFINYAWQKTSLNSFCCINDDEESCSGDLTYLDSYQELSDVEDSKMYLDAEDSTTFLESTLSEAG